MLYYWSRKIMALLHDPLDKILRAKHAEIAADIAGRLLRGNNLQEILENIRKHHSKKNIITNPDQNASAINRGIIGKHMQISDVCFQNPFSAHLRCLNIKAWKGSSSFESTRKYSIDKNGFFDLFRDLIGLYYNIYDSLDAKLIRQNLLLLPEDTRTPSSPMFPHLQMTSALINAFKDDSPEFYFVMVDIGGVQEFISNARKTRDFWASSYIVSLLSFAVLKEIAEKFGPDQIIMPWTLFLPIIDLVIYKRKLDDDLLDKLKSPLIPNTITALIPKYVDEKEYTSNEIRVLIEQALYRLWKIIIDEFKKYLQNSSKLKNIFSEIDDEQFERHLSFKSIFSKIRISVLDYKKINESNLIKLIDKKRCFDKIKNIPEDKLAYPHQILENFESYIDFLGRVNNSKKFMEDYRFKPTPSSESARDKCTMCGIREAIPEDKLAELRKLNLIDIDEKLCYLDLLKRFFDRIFWRIIKRISDNSIKDERKWTIPSTTDIGTIWFRASFLAFLLALIELKSEGNINDEIINTIKDMIRNLKKYKDEVEKVLREISPKEEQNINSMLVEYNYKNNKLLIRLFQRIKERAEDLSAEIELDEFLRYPSELLLKSEITTLVSRFINNRDKAREYTTKLKERFISLVENGFFNKFRNLLSENKISSKISIKAREILENSIRELLKFKSEIKVLTIRENLSDILPLAYAPQNRFCLLRADGDDMGKWIIGEKNLPWMLYIPPKHRESMLMNNAFKQSCGDGTILDRPRPISPSILSTLSMVISFQALMIQDIVESFGGFLIYTGGDDVLALVPPEIWYIVYLLTRFTFSREYSTFRSLSEFQKGINVYGLGWRATMSFSVVIANHKANLQWIINLSRDLLEEESKNLKKELNDEKENVLELKDALTVVLTSRSSILKKAGPMPNILFEDSVGIYALRELERIILYKKPTTIERKNYNELVKKIVSTGRSFIEHLAKTHSFEGITPKSQIGVDYKVYTMLDYAYELMKAVKQSEISMRALYTILEFYYESRERDLTEGDLLLLKYEIKSRVKQDATTIKTSNLVNELLANIENFSKVRYKVKDEDLSLLEFIPLAVILERILRNSMIYAH